MTRPRAVLLDAAGTLVQNRFDLARVAEEAAERIGLALSPGAGSRLVEAYAARLSEYWRLNVARADLRPFWADLVSRWLAAERAPVERAPELLAEADRALHDSDEVYAAYPDALPAMLRLRAAGIRLAVLSNWDATLHRVLARLGLDEPLEFALASLEHGVEKPDPRFFAQALERLGLRPEEVVHVGDDPVDDVQGAIGAGIRPIHLDRPAGDTLTAVADEILGS